MTKVVEKNSRKILITGGAGYIGSHTTLLMLQAGFNVIVLDSLCNSKFDSLRRVGKLSGIEVQFIEGDIRDSKLLKRIFLENSIYAVIHFAGLKAVAESIIKPLDYYDSNVVGTVCLLQAMRRANVNKIVFSSSATVYGDPASVPIKEDFALNATNPYGSTKLQIENILRDLHRAEPHWHIAILRYFNPAGAHESGEIGEDPSGTPNNLMPYIAHVAAGRLEVLNIFGNDYNTPDGTGIRDYIHVVDLAQGHIAALSALERQSFITCNLGTGVGYSVLEIVDAFSKSCSKTIPYRIVDRRVGDVAECYADSSRANELLGWKALRGLEEICMDHWRWQQQNPEGYKE